MAVKETVEHTFRTVGSREYPVTITRREGLDTYYDDDGKPFLADWATFIDFGPKMGVAKNYTNHRDTPYTEEEKAAGRRHIQEVAAWCLVDQGIW